MQGLAQETKGHVEQHDIWRYFSPYKGNDLEYQHLWLFVRKLVWEIIINVLTLTLTQVTRLNASPGCSVLTLVLLDRFMDASVNTILCTANIFPLFTAAYVLACKVVQDDCPSLLLQEVNQCMPFLSVRILYEMERVFLRAVDYRLHIDSQLYDQYLKLVLEHNRVR
eukprot:TRINITY_DN1355_c0_g1_i2.p1 TRINITY_DN1355_c0_g1~~TRINITY_DN1355_c0_g1_i2.p1  ORF type:complete len:167 (-),score=4.42 TRINITY_DN1355_c0_g1_i2:111-611(-)